MSLLWVQWRMISSFQMRYEEENTTEYELHRAFLGICFDRKNRYYLAKTLFIYSDGGRSYSCKITFAIRHTCNRKHIFVCDSLCVETTFDLVARINNRCNFPHRIVYECNYFDVEKVHRFYKIEFYTAVLLWH